MVKLVVEIECFGKSFDEFDKETGSSDGLQPKQADLSCVHALNEPHLHEIHVVPSKHEADQRDNYDLVQRYGDDKYDRIWYTTTSGSLVDLQTSGTVSNLRSSTTNEVPSKVMSTALTSRNITRDIYYPWTATDAAQEFFIYLYIAEIETLKSNQKREFNIYLNDVYWDGPVSPLDHTTTAYLIQSSKSLVNNNITLYHTDNSTLPPLFNAIEVYIPKQLRPRLSRSRSHMGSFLSLQDRDRKIGSRS
ncbi:leucine-rich repeat transmembrane protein kinase protein [Tanacetum coccineum]